MKMSIVGTLNKSNAHKSNIKLCNLLPNLAFNNHLLMQICNLKSHYNYKMPYQLKSFLYIT